MSVSVCPHQSAFRSPESASSRSRSRPDAATYLGAGKVDELREVVVATGADIADARERAYAHIARIDFTDGFARSDIASQARLDAIAARLG